MATPEEDADFILLHASRLVKVATMCVISFGLADGLNEALKVNQDADGDWHQAVLGFRDGTLMMAALRTAVLLDRDENKVSFQTVHSRLKSEGVRQVLLERLQEKFSLSELFGEPTADDLIARFCQTYSEISWETHGRLTHFRNLGIAHLGVDKMERSITFDELREFVSVISRLTTIVQSLCHTDTAFREWMLEDYRDYAEKLVKPN